MKYELIWDLREVANNLFSLPSSVMPILTPNIIIIGISLLLGWYYGKKAFPGFKIISILSLSIMFFCTMKYLLGG